MDGYEICPYEAVCPLGPDKMPVGGIKEDEKGTWLPILNSANDWVQVGKEDTCVWYSFEHTDPPSWGSDGRGD